MDENCAFVETGDINIDIETQAQNISDAHQSPRRSSETIKLLEYDSFIHSTMNILKGSLEIIFVAKILPCLNSYELSGISRTSHFFKRISRHPLLWDQLYKQDFDIDFIHNSTVDLPLIIHPGQSLLTKNIYINRYNEMTNKTKASKEEQRQFQLSIERAERVILIEKVLDWTQVRIVMPLLLCSIFVSICLFTQRIDGLNISFWVCSIPILTGITYLVVCIFVIKVIYKQQYSTVHLLRDMWQNFRGPLVAFFKEVCAESIQALYATLSVILLCILQVLLVTVKISKITDEHTKDTLPWGVVFLPLWILFTLYCVSPCIPRYRLELPAFVILFLVVWVPFFIFFVCLAVKLDGQEHMTSGRNIRLALIFMPFWIIESAVLLASLSFLLFGIFRYRRGFLERLDDHYAVFGLSWMSVVPFVVFQALLSARDDAQIKQIHNKTTPNATETVTPILIILGWVCIAATVISFSYKTAYEQARRQTLSNSAGLRVILPF